MNTSTSKNKTKRAALLLLLALLSASVARAQETITVTIGEGNDDDPGVPFNTWSNYSWTRQIYLADEIGTAGYITALSFHYDRFHYHYWIEVGSPETGDFHIEEVDGDDYTTPFSFEGLRVYLKHTDINDFYDNHDIVPLSESDKVWEGTFFALRPGWVTINFDTPFEYDGASNLVVCCYDTIADNYGYSPLSYLVFSSSELLVGNTRVISASSDNGVPNLNQNSYGSLSHRSNIQLHIMPEPVPVNLAVSNLTDISATLTWEAPQTSYNLTGYTYQYKKITDEEWSAEVTTTGTSAALSGLLSDTEYRFRIKGLFSDHEGIYTNIRFTTLAIPLPNMAVSDITEQSATITWEAPQTPYTITGYAYQYKRSPDADWSAETTTTSTSVTFTGLSGPMDYQFRAKALFSDHVSTYTYIGFTTLMQLPYECGFEIGMAGWSLVDCYTGNTTIRSNGITHEGNYSFRFMCYLYGQHTPQYLISPYIVCDGAVTVSFYHWDYWGNPTTFQIGHSTTTNDPAAFIWDEDITASYRQWNRYEHTFPAGTKYIALSFDYVMGAAHDLYLDDFSFMEYSNFPQPTNLYASNLTDHSAKIKWRRPSVTSNLDVTYAYQYKPVTDWEWSTLTTVSTTYVILNGLSPNTSYDFRVKAQYPNDLASSYVSTRFMTEGLMESLPHYQGFENGMGGWRVVDGHGSTGIYYNSQYNTHSFEFDWDNGDTPQYLISPLLDGSQAMLVSFRYQNYSDSTYSYLADFQVGYSTTTKDLDDFTWDDTIRSSRLWRQYIAVFPVGTKYVAVKWVRGFFLYLDDFSIEVNCPGSVIVDADHPFIENFTNNAAFPPRCWENPSVVVDGVNRQWIWDWFFSHNDSGSAYSSRYGTTYLKLPELYISDSVNSAQLSFWSLYTGLSDYAKCSVVLLDGDNETELWTPDVGSLQNERWYEIHIDLSAYIGQTINLAFKHEGNGISTWSIDNMKVSAPWSGDGTEQNPYIINSADKWNYFCDCLQDNDTWNRFSGKYVKLGADITVTRMAGSSTHDFMGTFDGQGHTITVAYGSAESPLIEEYAAPFRYVENGANIHNLHVDGHIYTSNKYAGGIVGCQYGTVSVSDCRSSVIVHSSKEGDGTHGGIVATQRGTFTLSGCVFDGRLLTTNGTTLCSGLVGYHNSGTCTISDCLYAPASDVTLAEGETYITDGATICRNYSGTPANCYYTDTLGEAQGQLAHSIASEDVTLAFAGEATEYDVSGITCYNTGIMYDSVLYASNGEEVSLTFTATGGFSVVAASYTPEGGTATEPTPVNEVYSFTMPDANVVINAVTEYIIHNTTEWDNFCDALQDNDTYNRFIGKTVRLATDITVTRMAGSSYHDFMGTFDGQGHTLTIAFGAANSPLSGEYAAPFRNVENGAVIHSLNVEGHIYTFRKFVGGIVGSQYGTVSVSNCRSSVIIHSGTYGEGSHGGIVANQHGTLTLSGCVFDGRLLTNNGTTLCSGLVGCHSDGTCTISNCLYAPATDVTLAPDETYISDGATFCRNYSGTPVNCYYTETLGEAQGKLAHHITGGAVTPTFAGEATEYDVSGITTCGTGLQYGNILYAGNGEEVNLTLMATAGFSVGTVTYTPEGGTATELIPVNGVYSFTMPDADVVIDATEYLIHNATEWENFCDALQDNDTYNRFIGKTVKLCADISVTRMAGSSTHDFMGTFDGQGHTLTIAYGTAESPITEEYAAPFRYVQTGANIHSLHVDGHIYTSNKFASGIAGCQYGTVSISNCRSSVIIHSSVNGDGTHGGIMAVQHGTLTVSGCVFDGRLLTTNGTTLCAGFIGWRYGTVTLSDCLYAPATDVNLAPDETCITNGATFCRSYNGTFDNCYYTETLGLAQGKLAHSITSEDVTLVFAGEATEYDVSGITTCGTGIMYDSMLYAGNGDEVNLTFPVPEGFSVTATYTPEGGTATEIIPVNGVYSFTMPDVDVVINAVTEYLIHNATEWNNFCDALQDNDTYNRFIGRTVKLCADISVTRMAGSDYHDFMGTFDGQGHTLTVAYGTAENPITEEYAAPFRNLENGAVIHSLHVDGHIYTSNQFASGIAGCQWGTVSISNCRSSVIIHSSVNGDGTHGGIVAVHHGTLTVSGCVFDGRLLTTNGTTLCGGLIGWRYGTVTISDCLYAPAEVTQAPGETCITNGATFCRNYNGTLDNCYYTESLSTMQGKLALTNPAVLPAGEPTATYDVSDLTFYSNGVQFGEVFYYDPERNFLCPITGYGTGNGGWQLITSPVAEAVTPTADNGFLTNEYDLFRFNPTHEDNEWENYKAGSFNLEAGKGYLYANADTVTLTFNGFPYSGNGEVARVYDATDTRKCWNLVGNPFPCAAYLDREYYVLNADGTGIDPEPIPASVPVPPCTAVFVKAVGMNDRAVFSLTAP